MSPGARVLSFRGPAREQSLRPPDQDNNHYGVDRERPELRHVIFAGNIGDAEEDRGEKRAGDARRSSDRKDDEEIDHELQRKLRVETEDLGAEGPAEPGKTGADGECCGEYRVDVDAKATCDTGIVHGRAQPAAEAR